MTGQVLVPVPQDPRLYYRRLLADNGLVEVRHQLGGRWHSFWFDNEADLLACLSAKGSAGDLFTSLNAPRLRIVKNGQIEQEALKNDEVAFITRLPFDFDPVRPSGTASTPEQLKHALDRRQKFFDLIAASGWGLPLLALSGNGYHAQHRTRLPNSSEVRDMLDLIYRGLATELSDELVSFDVSVRNAARIFRAYGSVNRKGGGNRTSTVWIPPRWQQLRIREVARLAGYFARMKPQVTPQARAQAGPRVTGRGDYRTLDVVAWFVAHGLYLTQIEPGKHAVRCPFADEHVAPTKPKDSVIWEATTGWPTFHCSHAHCADRTIKAVMQLFGDADSFCSGEFGQGGSSHA